jgi:hypothetical protein
MVNNDAHAKLPAEDFIKQNNLRYAPHCIVVDKRESLHYWIKLPHMCLMDKDGIVLSNGKANADDIEKLIEKEADREHQAELPSE